MGPRSADPDGHDGRCHRPDLHPARAPVTDAAGPDRGGDGGLPLVGPLLGAIPAILVAATVSPELALAVAGIYLVIQLVEGNVLVPLVMRNTIGLSPFLVIVSLLIGGGAGGIVGALLAVPIAAALLAVLERLQARDVPVAQDPGGVESVSRAEADSMAASLPDAATR
ncbi:MAG: AI-2E family transporter [Gemmatimonadales bacterium]|nr:AI-2E family transporter [Gemmatimonadales bacterium]